jgi:hypothetical protein
MNLRGIIQSVTCSSATAACVLALHNTASFASPPPSNRQPVQKAAIADSISIYKPTLAIADEPQLSFFDRNMKVPEKTARLWLIQRMKALQQRPPPTLQKVRAQWAASMEFSRKLEDKQIAFSNGRGNGASS